MSDFSEIDFRFELYRKGIHISSLSIPIIYFYISRDLALMILIPVTFVFISVDLLRFYHDGTSKIFYSVFRPMLRNHEVDFVEKRLNGASYVLLAATLSVLIFPKIIAITAFSILILSDTAAALIGRIFGLHKIFNNKSLEGSFAFFLTAILIVLATPKFEYSISEYFIGIFAALIGTIVELLPIPIDDNLTIPLSIGFSLWGLYLFFLPTLNLII
ncbi:MAG: diacylglycerol/polyprenol kinase family protein [Bacteroidota bacterium]